MAGLTCHDASRSVLTAHNRIVNSLVDTIVCSVPRAFLKYGTTMQDYSTSHSRRRVNFLFCFPKNDDLSLLVVLFRKQSFERLVFFDSRGTFEGKQTELGTLEPSKRLLFRVGLFCSSEAFSTSSYSFPCF
jgi:hypothetical protein